MAASGLANINLDYLLRNAPVVMVRRGSIYYHERRAMVISADWDSAVVAVEGSRDEPYEVEVTLHHDTTDYITLACDCPYGYDRPAEWCKHKVAAILEIRDHFAQKWTASWKDVLDQAISASPIRKRPDSSVLVFSLQTSWGRPCLVPYLLPVKPPGDGNAPGAEAIAALIQSDGAGQTARAMRRLPADAKGVIAAPLHLTAAGMAIEGRTRYDAQEQPIASILALLGGALIYRGDLDEPFARRLKLSESKAEAFLEISAVDDGLRLSTRISIDGSTAPLTRSWPEVISNYPLWVLAGDTLAQVDASAAFLAGLRRQDGLTVPASDQDAFFDEYLGPLAERMKLTGDAIGEWRDIRAEPVCRLYLNETHRTLSAELRFAYDGIELPFDAAFPEVSFRRGEKRDGVSRIYRSFEQEQAAWKALSRHGMKRAQPPGRFALRQGVGPADFLIHHLPGIAAAGYEVYGEEKLQSIRVNRSRPSISFSVSTGIDWFDLQAEITFGHTSASLKEFRKAVRKRERYVKLLDGSIGEIPEEWLSQYRHLFDIGSQTDEGIRLDNAQAMVLDRILEQADQARVDAEFSRRLSRLRGFRSIESREPPRGFTGELRPYQQHGYEWLHFLREYRFGGCLADDMGLGKTVQALAFIESLRESEGQSEPTLIVVRRSLLTNWQREAAHFAPGLKALVHTEGDRQHEASAFDSYDIVLTTYGIMRRDVEMLRSRVFRCIILDESQAIKNPESLTARAARQLQSHHRISLTGTPVENSTVELWSQFAFLNPGLLGSLDYFRREFAAPIERKSDEQTAEYLRSLVHPFILRRTKEQVAPELPARTERIVYCDLEHPQRKLYDQYRERYRSMLLGLIEEKGIAGARMRILEGLLRLRQISIHPLLVERAYKGESAKMEVLLETLETLRAEGHKALVFSQFTQMLRLVQKALKEQGIAHEYLDGQTRDRQGRIDSFQAQPEIPFFLISLKAGGVGLNLTAADYVIHIDPWWNPAVERQASDRTHRIGQEKPVFVHKLIARDTVEEKMLELQERKRNLVDRLVSTEGAFFKSLTASDVQALFS